MVMTVGSARIDERGKISGGAVGDSTGREVCTEKYYMHSQGWYMLRPKTAAHANAIAAAMLRACNNNNIGYDQNNRLGIITYGTSTKTKTECDCSSLVRQCVKEATGKDPGNFTTANEVSMLTATGLFNSKVAVTSGTVLCNGDILVTKTKGHTVIVVSGNARKETPTPKQVPGNPVNDMGVYYKAHCQTIGTQPVVRDGQVAGTTGYKKRLEGFWLILAELRKKFGNQVRAKAKVHIQGIGWIDLGYINDDTLIGSMAKAKRLEAIILEIEGLPEGYELQYQVHCQTYGWTGWVSAGFAAGSAGFGIGIEAIQIRIVKVA